MKIKTAKAEDIIEYIFAVALLLGCSSVYHVMNSRLYDYACLVLVTLLAVYKITKKRTRAKIRGNKLGIIILIYLGMILFVAVTIASMGIGFYIRFFFYVPIMLFVVGANTYEENLKFMRNISNVIYFLVITSVTLWVLGPLLNIVSPTGSIDIFWGYQTRFDSYYRLLYTTGIQRKYFLGQILRRNLSIYPEGPFANLIFTLGFAYEMFLNPKSPSKFKVIIYVLAMISTLSTTGMLMLLVILGIKYIFIQTSQGRKHGTSYAFRTFVVPIFVIIVGYIASTYVLDYKQINDEGNFLAHMGDFAFGLQHFLSRPITGYGFNYTGFSLTGNNTSGLFKVLTYGGIPFGLLYLTPLFRGIYNGLQMKERGLVVFAAIVFVMFLLVIWQNTFLLLTYLCVFGAVGLTENRI